MRLIPAGTDMYEVQDGSRTVGRVWLYQGLWRGETNAGTPARGVAGETAEMIGSDVVKLARRGR